MGKIKAGNKTTKLERFFNKKIEPIVLTNTQEVQCPVVKDYRVRKFARLLRKKQKDDVVNYMIADVKLAVRCDNNLAILKQQLLGEIDGSFHANALPIQALKEKLEEFDNRFSTPMIIQQSPGEVKVIEKHVTFTKELVLPDYVKYSLLGLALVNILIILFK